MLYFGPDAAITQLLLEVRDVPKIRDRTKYKPYYYYWYFYSNWVSSRGHSPRQNTQYEVAPPSALLLMDCTHGLPETVPGTEGKSVKMLFVRIDAIPDLPDRFVKVGTPYIVI